MADALMKACSKCGEEKPIEQFDRYRTCKACSAKRQREYRKANPDRVRLYEKNRKNPAERRERVREWQAANREYVRAANSTYGKTHRTEINARLAEWRRRVGYSRTDYARKRRAIKMGCDGAITRGEWAAMVAEYDGRCAYCLAVMLVPTQDHVIPLSKGGAHTASNIVPACLSCNSAKRDREVREFLGVAA